MSTWGDDTFEIGDRVLNTGSGTYGYVTDVMPAFVEVKIQGTVELRIWNISMIVKNGEQVKKKCTCTSRDLFHYGCQCGFFAKEKNAL